MAFAGILSIGVDGGIFYTRRLALQTVADTAALSAANAIAANGRSAQGVNVTLEASAVASTYGVVDGQNGTTITVNNPPATGKDKGVASAVEVVIATQQARYFSSLLGSGAITIQARGVAQAGSPGNGCVLTLDETAVDSDWETGSANVDLHNCSLYANSSTSAAVAVSGNARLSALSVNVVGGVYGSANITTTQGINTKLCGGATGVCFPDPYARVPMQNNSGNLYAPVSSLSDPRCDYVGYSTQTSVTLSPGVYCGGLAINSQATATFNPGVYVLDEGSFSVSGQATLQNGAVNGVSGVTFVFTGSGGNWAAATINGGAKVSLTAPTTGNYAGIVFYGDRNMPVGTSFTLNGGQTMNFGGAVDLPKAALNFIGGAYSSGASTNYCTQLIADTIKFAGNSNTNIDNANCINSGMASIGASSSTLAE